MYSVLRYQGFVGKSFDIGGSFLLSLAELVIPLPSNNKKGRKIVTSTLEKTKVLFLYHYMLGVLLLIKKYTHSYFSQDEFKA